MIDSYDLSAYHDDLLRYVHNNNPSCESRLEHCPNECAQQWVFHHLDLDTAIAWRAAKDLDDILNILQDDKPDYNELVHYYDIFTRYTDIVRLHCTHYNELDDLLSLIMDELEAIIT